MTTVPEIDRETEARELRARLDALGSYISLADTDFLVLLLGAGGVLSLVRLGGLRPDDVHWATLENIIDAIEARYSWSE